MAVVASLIIGGITTALGLYQSYKSKQALEEIEAEEKPRYEVSPEMRQVQQRAQERARFGYAPEQEAAFRQELATSGATAYQRGIDIGGGGQAQALRAAIKARDVGAISQFAAGGAALQQQNIRYADAITAQIQQQQNLQTQEEFEERLRREQAFGVAGKTGMENIVEGLTTGIGLAFGGTGETGGVQTGAPIATGTAIQLR